MTPLIERRAYSKRLRVNALYHRAADPNSSDVVDQADISGEELSVLMVIFVFASAMLSLLAMAAGGA